MVSPDEVLETLFRATSQEVSELKRAEALLAEWETMPGFYTLLLQVILDHNLQPTVRWMAALTFKNGVDRYWRKTAPNAICEREKQSLRVGLMGTLNEPVNQVAIQLAVVIAKTARFDYPREWPELLPMLMELVLKSEDPLTQHRALLVLNHVIKTLASKRLGPDRKTFHEVTSQLYGCILNLSHAAMDAFFQQVQGNNPQCQVTLEKAVLTIQIMKKLTIHGFKEPRDSQEVHVFVTSIFDKVKNFLFIRKTFEENGSSVDMLEKGISHLMKVPLSLLENHPFSFVPFIHNALSFTSSMLFSAQGEVLLFPKFVIQCLTLMKSILICAEYQVRKPKDKDDQPLPAVQEANQMKEEFFKPDVLVEIFDALVTRYLPLSQEELALWDSDPEGFENEEAGESTKYVLRPATEALYLALFHSYNAVLIPILLRYVYSNHQPVPPHDLSAVLRKDAVYLAVGLGSMDLYEEVDMNKWFSGLQAELTIKEGHYRIIRRRAAWLLGEWTGVKLAAELRPALYRSFLALLRDDEDMAVRLTAAKALKRAVDDFEFDETQFIEFLESFANMLFDLLRKAKECDTKMHVLTVLSFLVERMGEAIKPFSAPLMQYLPLLWNESKDHNMLRCAIVTTMNHCVRALVAEELNLCNRSFLYHVLDVCVDMSQESHLYLMEDGLELWLAVLEFSEALCPPMLTLLKYMPNILETSTEHLDVCCMILKAYLLLAPSTFFEDEYGIKIFSCLYEIISDMKPEGIAIVYNFIELCVLVDPDRTVNTAMPLVQEAFLRIHDDERSPAVLSAILPVISRILLHSYETFCHIISQVALRLNNETAEACFQQILSTWCWKMRFVVNATRLKIVALAQASLLTADSPVVFSSVPDIIRDVVSVLNDIMDVGESGEAVDTMVVAGEVQDGALSRTEHERRLKKFNDKDLAYKINLRDYFKSQMTELAKRIGNSAMDRILSELSPDTIDSMKLYVL